MKIFSKVLLTIGIIVLVLGLVTYAALVSVFNINGTGIVQTVGVRASVTSINWGMIAPGSSTSQTITVYNDGTVPMTVTMNTTNWNPVAAANYMNVTWDRQNAVVGAGGNIAATLTLSVSSSVTGITTFSMNIVLTGTG